MFNLSSSTAQFRRNARADSDVTEDTDVESVSPSPQTFFHNKPFDLSVVTEVESPDQEGSPKPAMMTPPRPSTPTPTPAPSLTARPPGSPRHASESPAHSSVSDPSTAHALPSALSSPAHTVAQGSPSPRHAPVHRAATLPPRVGSPGSPTEELARLQQGQPRRIAEYKAGSLTELRDLSPSGAASPTAQRKGTAFQNFELAKQVDSSTVLA